MKVYKEDSNEKPVSNYEDILNAALSLPPQERATLADRLFASLDDDDQQKLNALWAEEAERRMKEIRGGKVKILTI